MISLKIHKWKIKVTCSKYMKIKYIKTKIIYLIIKIFKKLIKFKIKIQINISLLK